MIRFIQGDAAEVLATLPADSVHMCVTSPPYYGLRSYLGADHKHKHREIGSEQTPAAYIANLVAVFRQVKRVLRPDGCVFIVIGDSYASAWACSRRNIIGNGSLENGKRADRPNRLVDGLKEKDLIGIPWMLATALRAGFSTCTCGREMRSDLWPVHNGHKVCIDCLMERREHKIVETEKGWWLRSEIIWDKPSCLPESVRDRPTRSHEQIFMLTKSARYFWDIDAVKEPHARLWNPRTNGGSWAHPHNQPKGSKAGHHSGKYPEPDPAGRNIRSVWHMASEPSRLQHYAAYPTKLVETCIKAGTSERGVCPTCGAPWVRVVERKISPPTYRPTNTPIRHLAVSSSGNGTNGTGKSSLGMVGHVSSISFCQSCSCPSADPIPATVLDCFAGSGTTGLVADRLQRNAILIDISDEYERMARTRIQDDAPLFAQVM